VTLDDPDWPFLTSDVSVGPARVAATARVAESLLGPGGDGAGARGGRGAAGGRDRRRHRRRRGCHRLRDGRRAVRVGYRRLRAGGASSALTGAVSPIASNGSLALLHRSTAPAPVHGRGAA